MNIIIKDNSEYLKCQICSGSVVGMHGRVYHSRICPHKLCDACFSKSFMSAAVVNCKVCHKPQEQKDYNIKSREEIYDELDKRNRNKIMPVYYLKISDFPSEEEYDNYLEEIEDKCIKLF